MKTLSEDKGNRVWGILSGTVSQSGEIGLGMFKWGKKGLHVLPLASMPCIGYAKSDILFCLQARRAKAKPLKSSGTRWVKKGPSNLMVAGNLQEDLEEGPEF